MVVAGILKPCSACDKENHVIRNQKCNAKTIQMSPYVKIARKRNKTCDKGAGIRSGRESGNVAH